MEIPFICSCGQETMVDMDKLERRPLDKLIMMEGFLCRCGAWKPVYFETALLKNAMRKVVTCKHDFKFHFGKALRQARTTYERGMGMYAAEKNKWLGPIP